MTDRRVTVFGAGPSGLMAGWACVQSGWDVEIYDPAPKPPDGRSAGVFYLHDNCDMNLPQTTCRTFAAEGDRAGYALKMYGAEDAPCSWPDQERWDVVYDGMAAMERLWSALSPSINQGFILSYQELMVWNELYPGGGPIISTAPLDRLLGIQLPHRTAAIAVEAGDMRESTVSYNGIRYSPIYRVSELFGRRATEFVPGHEPVKWGADNGTVAYHTVRKVEPTIIGHALQRGLDSNILLAGRYGRWDKSCLTHNVYHEVKRWLEGRDRKPASRYRRPDQLGEDM